MIVRCPRALKCQTTGICPRVCSVLLLSLIGYGQLTNSIFGENLLILGVRRGGGKSIRVIWLLGGYLFENPLELSGSLPVPSISFIQNYVKSIFPALSYITEDPAPQIALALGVESTPCSKKGRWEGRETYPTSFSKPFPLSL